MRNVQGGKLREGWNEVGHSDGAVDVIRGRGMVMEVAGEKTAE